MSDSRPLAKRLIYSATQVVLRVAAVGVFGLRSSGSRNYPSEGGGPSEGDGPSEGGGLVCANHQSYLDPVLIGICCRRSMNYLARDTLFKFGPLGRLIEFYNGIPIDREGSGLTGIKETLRRLKRGELVLIFPEGTRSTDGEIQPMRSGVCTLARRAGVPLVPVGIDGACQAWPRSSRLPRLARIGIHVGRPILPADVSSLSNEELTARLANEISACHARARRLRQIG